MAWWMAIPAAVGAAQSIIGAVKSKDRPEYEIPKGLRTALAVSQARATSPYSPGYSAAKSQADIQAANMVTAAQQSGQALSGLPTVEASIQQSSRALQEQNEKSRFAAEQQYMDVLGDVADAEDLEFQMNEFAPYAGAMQTMTSGIENIFDTAAAFGKYQTGADTYGA